MTSRAARRAPDFELVGVVRGRGDDLRVEQSDLDGHFEPKKSVTVTEALLRERGRGLAYTKTAPAYVFQRRQPDRHQSATPR